MKMSRMDERRASRARVKEELLKCGITEELSEKWAWMLVPSEKWTWRLVTFARIPFSIEIAAIEVVTKLREMLEQSNKERQRIEKEWQAERESQRRKDVFDDMMVSVFGACYKRNRTPRQNGLVLKGPMTDSV